MSSDLDRAIAICCEFFGYRPKIRRRLGEQVNAGLKAQSLEQDRSTGIVREVRCDQHERPIWKCHQQHLPCEAGKPLITDTTGEAGTNVDKARATLADLDHAENDLILAANRLIGHPLASHANLVTVLAHHGYLMAPTVKRSASVFDRALGEVLGRKAPKAGLDHAGMAGCASCQRLKLGGVPYWSDPTYRAGTPTDLGGILPRKMALDFGCYRFIIENERLPTVAELQHRATDPRGHWPKKHVTTRRAG